MRIAAALSALLLSLPLPALAQNDEDAAHRADRLRTQALNQRSPNGYSATPGVGEGDRAQADYVRAEAEYRRRLAEWHNRVAACERGYYNACQR